VALNQPLEAVKFLGVTKATNVALGIASD
jgi:hypothetical protein